MNIPTFIILALLAVAVCLAVRQVRKKGVCSCRSCDCACSKCPKRR